MTEFLDWLDAAWWHIPVLLVAIGLFRPVTGKADTVHHHYPPQK